MRITIDTSNSVLEVVNNDVAETHELHSKEAFALLSDWWVRLGWVRKYSYGFTWMGRPIIQLPEDMIRIQEAVFEVKPDVIIETGIAHGGSLVFLASLMDLIGKGRVIGLDIEIRPQNREAIERHSMMKRITMIEGNSVSEDVVARVKSLIGPNDTVMLILDSNHSREHVSAELNAYATLVTPGSYILSQDGVMQFVAGMPRTEASWNIDNPITAVDHFLANNRDFALVQPPRPFDETDHSPDCTHHPKGWIKRRAG